MQKQNIGRGEVRTHDSRVPLAAENMGRGMVRTRNSHVPLAAGTAAVLEQ